MQLYYILFNKKLIMALYLPIYYCTLHTIQYTGKVMLLTGLKKMPTSVDNNCIVNKKCKFEIYVKDLAMRINLIKKF